MIRIFTILFLLLVLQIHLSAQIFMADTVKIPTVTIHESKSNKEHLKSMKSIELDSLQRKFKISDNLTDILKTQSSIFIKSYGSNGLASVSFRGTSAAHTKVLWNGISLNSVMNSQVDFSLFPIFFFDELNINYGAASLAYADGCLGGSIDLKNEIDFENKLKFDIQQSIASFDNYTTAASFQLGNKNIQSRTKIYRKSGLNNFSYRNLAEEGFPKKELENSAVLQYGFQQELFYQINSKNRVEAQFWWFQSDREIPSIMLVNNNNESQSDLSNRMSLAYTTFGDKFKIHLRSTYINESLLYKNELLQNESLSDLNSIKNALKFNYQWVYNLSSETNVLIDFNQIDLEKENVNTINVQNSISIAESIQHQYKKRFYSNLVLKYQSVSKQDAVILAALGTNFRWINNKDWFLRVNASTNAKYPSINDLYWQPGGNQNLIMEKSKNLEVGIFNNEIQLNEYQNIQITSNVYYMNISDYILWQPTAFGYWKAVNIEKVISKGVENNWSITTKFAKFSNITSINYSYVQTESINKRSENDASANKQLIYIPKNRLELNTEFNYKNWMFNYNMSYSDKRYTSTDNSEFLPYNLLHNISLEKKVIIKNQLIKASFNVNNLFNTDYQAIQWRPMPLRNYQLTLKYQFQQ